jgi:hypothetical protein
VTLYRCFAWNRRAKPADADGPLWFPRSLQGEGRHDNPDVYACLYLSEREVSAVVEQLARFRSQRLTPSLLRRRGLPLAIASLELADPPKLIVLDDPRVLLRGGLRPSVVATRQRAVTQPQARAWFDRSRETNGLRWWSTDEAAWMNVTLFDRAAAGLRVESMRELSITDPTVIEATEFLGLIAKAGPRS